MIFFSKTITIDSTEKLEIFDITRDVTLAISASNIKQGLVNVFTRHTTTALRINENEPRFLEDLKLFLEQHAPRNGNYLHDDIDERDVPIENDY